MVLYLFSVYYLQTQIVKVQYSINRILTQLSPISRNLNFLQN